MTSRLRVTAACSSCLENAFFFIGMLLLRSRVGMTAPEDIMSGAAPPPNAALCGEGGAPAGGAMGALARMGDGFAGGGGGEGSGVGKSARWRASN